MKPLIFQIKGKLSGFGVDPYDLSRIDQTNCPGDDEKTKVDISIDDETFSPQSIAGVVRKVHKTYIQSLLCKIFSLTDHTEGPNFSLLTGYESSSINFKSLWKSKKSTFLSNSFSVYIKD